MVKIKSMVNWMKNTRDWCISRQLWWGHQIPAWYCDDCGETVVAKSAPCLLYTSADCEMANLTDPEGVKKVHAEYLAAGAQAITISALPCCTLSRELSNSMLSTCSSRPSLSAIA